MWCGKTRMSRSGNSTGSGRPEGLPVGSVTPIEAFREMSRRVQQRVAPDTAPCGDSIGSQVVGAVLGIPDDVATDAEVEALFGDPYEPGTFTIAERKQASPFLYPQDNLGYDTWIRSEIESDLSELESKVDAPLGDLCIPSGQDRDRLVAMIVQLFNYEVQTGTALCELVANQEYTDVFRRAICGFVAGDPDAEFDTYASFNNLGRRLAFGVLRKLDDLALDRLLRVSIAAGLIGLNLKRSASAASNIVPSDIIPIDQGLSVLVGVQ